MTRPTNQFGTMLPTSETAATSAPAYGRADKIARDWAHFAAWCAASRENDASYHAFARTRHIAMVSVIVKPCESANLIGECGSLAASVSARESSLVLRDSRCLRRAAVRRRRVL